MPPKKRTSSAATAESANDAKPFTTAKTSKTNKSTKVAKTNKSANTKKKEGSDAAEDAEPKPKRKRLNKNPYPDAPLDHRRYPQILDTVLKFHESWLPLRATGKAMKKRIEPLLYEKIVIKTAKYEDWCSKSGRELHDMLQNTDMTDEASFARFEEYMEKVLFEDGGADGDMDDLEDLEDLFKEPRLHDNWGDPLIAVVGHHNRLPFFPPREYMEDEHGRAYHNERKRWSALLKKHATIVDIHTDMLMCHLDYLDDALTNLQALRIFMTEASSGFFHFGYPPISGFNKLILMPFVPSPNGFVSNQIKLFGGTYRCKVVSNVLFTPESGPFHARLQGWRDYHFNDPPEGLKDVVYVFKPLKESELEVPASMDEYRKFAEARWVTLLHEILFHLQPDSGGKVMRPTVILVDFPADGDITKDLAKLPSCKIEEIPESPAPVDYFSNAIKNRLVSLQEENPGDYNGQATALFDRVKFLSLAEYAATLKPGDLAIETARTL